MSKFVRAVAGVTHCGQGSPVFFVIEDEEAVCRVVARALGRIGINVRAFKSAREVFAVIDTGHPSAILLDVSLQQCDAIDVIHGLSERHYRGPVFLMSGAREQIVEAVQRIGIREGLTFGAPLHKPFTLMELAAIGKGGVEATDLNGESGGERRRA
jgi:DNA-binding NtrC family response regulator